MGLLDLFLVFHGVQNLIGLAAFLLAGVVYLATLND